MKKVLFFAITLMIVSCNNNKGDQEENNNVRGSDIENPDVIDEKDSNKPEAQSFIIINKTGFPTQSLNYLKSRNAIALEIPGQSIFYVDLLSVADTEAGIASWLLNHDTYINFPLSYPFIEMAHNLRTEQDLLDVSTDSIPETEYTTYTWTALENRLNQLGFPVDYHQYDYYLNLGNPEGTINTSRSGFHQTQVIYSMPLFKSIIVNHGLTNPNIAFANATVRDNMTKIIRVSQGSFVGYYDFTHRPPIKQIEPKDVTYKFL